MIRHTLAHLFTTRRQVNRMFRASSLDALERAVVDAERGSSGQIRIFIESAWPLLELRRTTSRQRALDWFSRLRVWDTEHNNGVLIYLLVAERTVEIVADRGFNGRVPSAQWAAICRSMRQEFQQGEFERGLAEGIRAVGELLRMHTPAASAPNEQPDRPILA